MGLQNKICMGEGIKRQFIVIIRDSPVLSVHEYVYRPALDRVRNILKVQGQNLASDWAWNNFKVRTQNLDSDSGRMV